MTSTIELSNGEIVTVDKEDVAALRGQPWHKHSQGYAVSSGGRQLMHRLITGASKGAVVDHVNGDKLDNRRSNLRIVSHSSNSHNRHASTKPAGLRELSSGRWAVYLWVENKNRYVGSRDTLNEAVQLRADAELEHLGELSPATKRALTRR